jgi:hypothetical protein
MSKRPEWVKDAADFFADHTWLVPACCVSIFPAIVVLGLMHAPVQLTLVVVGLLLLPAVAYGLVFVSVALIVTLQVVATSVWVAVLALVWFLIPPQRIHVKPHMQAGISFLASVWDRVWDSITGV